MEPGTGSVRKVKTPIAVQAPSVASDTPPAKASNGHQPIELSGLLHALQAKKVGDFSVRMPSDGIGLEGKIADVFNEIIAANQLMAKQLERVGQVVGREGKTRQRVKFDLSSGAWGEMENSVNALIDDLAARFRDKLLYEQVVEFGIREGDALDFRNNEDGFYVFLDFIGERRQFLNRE